MKVMDWYKKRGLTFVVQRARRLSERYGVTPQKAMQRISRCVEDLSAQGCSPTFFVPAVVVRRNLDFFKLLQDCGCELGAHGFQHVDLTSYPPEQAHQQLKRAVEFMQIHGFLIEGFRCPYLSSSDELIHSLEPDLFNYSSNQAITWKIEGGVEEKAGTTFTRIDRFYKPLPAEFIPRLPWIQEGVVEIPVCVPDDLQLYDGLGHSIDEITGEWISLLKETHHRGELFNLMFHPELSAKFEDPYLAVLRAARQISGKIWVTRLNEVGRWWRKQQQFGVSFIRNNDTWIMQFSRDPHATILFRGMQPEVKSQPWGEGYQRLMGSTLHLRTKNLPLIGLEENLPGWVKKSLQQKGYITLTGSEGYDCEIILDHQFLEGVKDPVTLGEKIEALEIPLIRYWPWPDGARSALCLSGDLDALSLMDYSTRLLPA